MPFEPRLFSSGDDQAAPAGELVSAELSPGAGPKLLVADEPDADLPDELAALAAQLRDEAATLARQHPPRPVEAPLAPAIERRRRGLWLWPAAAAILVAAGLTAWRIERLPIVPVTQPKVTAEPIKSLDPVPTAVVAASPQPVKHHSATTQPDSEPPHSDQGIAEVSVTDPQAPTHGTTDELSMLRRQVDGFEKLIHRFQAELVARDAAEAASQRQIEALQQENEQLRNQLHDAQAKR